jgi:hypothetical protein
MPKGFWLLFVMTLLFSLGFFIFLYLLFSKQFSEIEKVTPEPVKNFIIKEESDFKIITNPNLQLKCSIPKEWKIEKEPASNILFLLSPETKISQEKHTLEQGCLIGLQAQSSVLEEKFHILENTIKDFKEKKQSQGNFSLVQISGRDALKEETEISDFWQIRVSLPYNGSIIVFSAIFSGSEKGKCLNFFEEFLKSVEVNQGNEKISSPSLSACNIKSYP